MHVNELLRLGAKHRDRRPHGGRARRAATVGRHRDGDRPARLGQPGDRRPGGRRRDAWSTASTTSTAATTGWKPSCAARRRHREGQVKPSAPLMLALSKGRIFDETLPLLAAAGIEVLEDPEKSRKLILATNRADVRRGAGARHRRADLRAVRRRRPRRGRLTAARHVLLETRRPGPVPAAGPGIAHCRMSVAVRADFDYAAAVKQGSRIRVATKYVQHRARALRRQGRARRPDQALRLDGAGAADRPGRRDRRPGVHRQHAQGQPAGRGRAHHGHQRRGWSSTRRRSSSSARRSAAHRCVRLRHA